MTRKSGSGMGGGSWEGGLILALLLALAVSVLPMGPRPVAAAGITRGAYAITVDQLNLRSGPGAGYGVMRSIPCGAWAYVNAGPYNSSWYKVTYAGMTGYAHGAYLIQGSTASRICTSATAVATAGLNLRSGPGTSYRVKRVIPQGGTLKVKQGPYKGVWYTTTYRGTVGYVHGSYLTQGAAVTVRKLDTRSKVVALTFDAGSDRGYAAQILNTLKASGVKASFGITGKWAEANADLVRRMVNEGHTVFNHTYSHRSLTGYSSQSARLSYAQRADELWKTESILQKVAGISTKPYFRPPYGDYDTSVLVDVRTRGYTLNLMWSVDSLGWRGLTKGQIVQRVVGGLEPGAMYLFHVGSQSQDGPALSRIIQELRARGYSFTTVHAFYR